MRFIAVGSVIERPMSPLSSLFRDPFLRDAFKRAERDGGDTAAVAIVRPRTRDGGAVERPAKSSDRRRATERYGQFAHSVPEPSGEDRS